MVKVTKSTKTCIGCKNPYPATAEYFRRDATKSDGFGLYCKTCAKVTGNAISRALYNRTVEEKGVLGFRCPLWTERCGECRIINTCWRLVGSQTDDLPAKLVGHLAGTLRKKGE